MIKALLILGAGLGRTVNPNVPPCVTAIIDKALAKQVVNRYQTGAEMAEAIRQCAASLH